MDSTTRITTRLPEASAQRVQSEGKALGLTPGEYVAQLVEKALATVVDSAALPTEPHTIVVRSGCGAVTKYVDFAGIEARIHDALDPHQLPIDQRPGATFKIEGAVPA